MEENKIKKYYEENPEGLPGNSDIPEIYEMHKIFEHNIKKENYKKLLDAGCGKGYTGKILSKLTNQYYGFDISSTAVKIAQKRIPNGVFNTGTLRYLPYEDNYFDCVVCSEVLEHIPDYGLAIKELSRVVKPGKKIFISTPNRINPDMAWQLFRKEKYTSQIYDTPIHYKILIKEFQKQNLEVINYFSFWFLPIFGEDMPHFIKKPLMKMLEILSGLIKKPLGLYLFFVLRKKL